MNERDILEITAQLENAARQARRTADAFQRLVNEVRVLNSENTNLKARLEIVAQARDRAHTRG